MVVVPVNICVPEDVYAEILNGTLELYGLVKDSEHKIRKHLPTIKNATEAGAKKALEVIKEHKEVSIIVLSVIAVSTCAAVTFSCIKNNKYKKNIVTFNKCLEAYYSSIKEGTLSNEVIDDLLHSLDIIEEQKASIKISPDKLSAIIFSIYDYTNKLAEANNQRIKAFKPTKKDNLIDMREYLQIQKGILQAA